MQHTHLRLLVYTSMLLLVLTASSQSTTTPPSIDSSHLIDLHSHSSLSDGTDSPRELIRKAHEKGVKVLAITDHDQLTYDEDAIRYGESLGMTIIRGTELSCEWTFSKPQLVPDGKGGTRENTSGKLHLLGYFTHASSDNDGGDPLVNLLNGLKPSREGRNLEILQQLKRQFGISIKKEDVIAFARDDGEKEGKDQKQGSSPGERASPPIDYFGRPHIARALVQAGHASSVTDAFQKYLNDEVLQLKPWSLDLSQAARAIEAHGGVAVIAHPVTIGLTMDQLESELDILLQHTPAIKGLEVYSSKSDKAQAADLLRIAVRFGLVPTGGSDYHGTNKEGVPLGVFRKQQQPGTTTAGDNNDAAADAQDSTDRWTEISTKSFALLTALRRGDWHPDFRVDYQRSTRIHPGLDDHMLLDQTQFGPRDFTNTKYWLGVLVLACASCLVLLRCLPMPPSNDTSTTARFLRWCKTLPLLRSCTRQAERASVNSTRVHWSDRA